MSVHPSTNRRPRRPLPYRLAITLLGLLCACVMPFGEVQAADITSSDSVNLKGVVTGPPPSVAAVIQSPSDGFASTKSGITVTGTCDGDVVVEIYKNALFAGSAICTNDRFSLDIELVLGTNKLMARVTSQTGQYGPDSSPVTVTYGLPGGTKISGRMAASQLIVTTTTPTQAVKTGQNFDLNLTISGGKGPYTVSIDWGDGTASPVPRDETGEFTVSHTYSAAGMYATRVTVTDGTGAQTMLQLITLVNGSRIFIDPGSSTEDRPLDSSVSPTLPIIWPLYLLLTALLLSFLFGKRYGEHNRPKKRSK